MSIIHYKARHIFEHQLPGLNRFRGYFHAYGRGVMPIDRGGSIRFPVKTQSLFPLPTMRIFSKSYEQICNERAVQLLRFADGMDVPLYCFWSGGIDSTCVLVSLLKAATPAQRERIVVLLSEASISEYPDFYRNQIRGKLARAPASRFPYLIGTRNLLVSGEHNDQLFGSDVIAEAIKNVGFDAVMAPYDRKLFLDFFTTRMEGDRDAAHWYVGLFELLRERAPVPLKSNYDLFWWINFNLKWQNVFMRMLSFVAKRNVAGLTPAYVENFYWPFFCSDDFQLWSMNNMDKRVRGSWRGYKWPAKDVIYDFTRDADYRDSKLKLGSLQFLIRQQAPAAFIDDKFGFHESVTPDVFYAADNDFTGQTWN